MKIYIILMVLALTGPCLAEIRLTDDSGQQVVLDQPARRIISLAPHLTELLFEMGAGEKIVGTMEYSDFPQAALAIPRVGSHNALDLERILILKPDIILVWQSGNPHKQIEKLQQMGIPIYFSEPRKLLHIATTIERLGILTGETKNAQRQKQLFINQYRKLEKTYKDKTKLSVFYEIWNQPMMTINGEHIINEIIELCGGENVFKELSVLAPTVNVEAVLHANPQVIIASGVGDKPPPWLSEWNKWQNLSAVRHKHIYHINPDSIHRQSSRILNGAVQICQLLENARQ